MMDKLVYSLRSWIQSPFVILVALVLLATSAYINVLDGKFIWDDEVMVAGNGLIRSLDNIPAILTTSPFGGRLNASDFYRPFQTLSYAVDYSIWGLDPTGFHLTNLILHGITVLVLFILLRRLGYSSWVSGGVSAIFAVHPLNTESVSYISGRGDVMYLLLCLSVFWLFTVTTFRRAWIIPISLGLYWVALLTKENSVPLGVMLAGLIVFPVFGNLNKTQKISAGLLAASSIFYSGLRAYFLASDGNTILSWIANADLMTRIKTIPYCVVTYFRLFILPYPLHMEYHYVETSWLNPYLWVGMPFIAFAGFVIWKYSLSRAKTVFWMVWIMVCLGPVLQLVPLASTVREHWATMAELGFWVAVLSVLDIQSKSKLWVTTGLICGIAVYWSLTVVRNEDWRDPIQLYRHDVAFEPKSFLLHNNLGVELFRKNELSGAKIEFEAAIDTSPNQPLGYGTALNNLGAIYEGRGDLVKAEGLYIKAIESSQYELAYCNLARVLLIRGDVANALNYVHQGIEHYPYNATLKLMLVGALFSGHHPDDAEREARNLLMMYPEYGSQVDFLRRQYEANPRR